MIKVWQCSIDGTMCKPRDLNLQDYDYRRTNTQLLKKNTLQNFQITKNYNLGFMQEVQISYLEISMVKINGQIIPNHQHLSQ